jgi:hypothetical protein
MTTKRETGGKASMMDLLERKLDKTSDQDLTKQGISDPSINSQVISSQVVSQDPKNTISQVPNTTIIHESVRVAFKERPRVSFWSPRVSAILYCLKKTIPDFSKSEEVETLLEEALSKKYPELYKLVTEEMEKSN